MGKRGRVLARFYYELVWLFERTDDCGYKDFLAKLRYLENLLFLLTFYLYYGFPSEGYGEIDVMFVKVSEMLSSITEADERGTESLFARKFREYVKAIDDRQLVGEDLPLIRGRFEKILFYIWLILVARKLVFADAICVQDVFENSVFYLLQKLLSDDGRRDGPNGEQMEEFWGLLVLGSVFVSRLVFGLLRSEIIDKQEAIDVLEYYLKCSKDFIDELQKRREGDSRWAFRSVLDLLRNVYSFLHVKGLCSSVLDNRVVNVLLYEGEDIFIERFEKFLENSGFEGYFLIGSAIVYVPPFADLVRSWVTKVCKQEKEEHRKSFVPKIFLSYAWWFIFDKWKRLTGFRAKGDVDIDCLLCGISCGFEWREFERDVSDFLKKEEGSAFVDFLISKTGEDKVREAFLLFLTREFSSERKERFSHDGSDLVVSDAREAWDALRRFFLAQLSAEPDLEILEAFLWVLKRYGMSVDVRKIFRRIYLQVRERYQVLEEIGFYDDGALFLIWGMSILIRGESFLRENDLNRVEFFIKGLLMGCWTGDYTGPDRSKRSVYERILIRIMSIIVAYKPWSILYNEQISSILRWLFEIPVGETWVYYELLSTICHIIADSQRGWVSGLRRSACKAVT